MNPTLPPSVLSMTATQPRSSLYNGERNVPQYPLQCIFLQCGTAFCIGIGVKNRSKLMTLLAS